MTMRVLVVDDAAFMRTILKRILEGAGFRVVGEAGNGVEAFSKYKELQPDLVTMDITMPDSDGIEGLSLIKEYDKNAKVIMCSAMGQKAYVLEAIQKGAMDFIVKPFDNKRVIEAINRVRVK